MKFEEKVKNSSNKNDHFNDLSKKEGSRLINLLIWTKKKDQN